MSDEKFGSSQSEDFVDDNLKCRQIVREITQFGVSQRQIYLIMLLLSLELENIDHLKELSTALREMREDTHVIKQVDEHNENFVVVHEENIEKQ